MYCFCVSPDLEKIDDENGGKFRKIQNYIVKESNGKIEIVYTPPPTENVSKMMSDLVEWINKAVKEEISPVIIAGVSHYEFVSIPPFLRRKRHNGKGDCYLNFI